MNRVSSGADPGLPPGKLRRGDRRQRPGRPPRLAEGPVQLVISDFMMPGMNGASSCAKSKRFPDTIRIMLTGHNTDAVMGAINDGAV